MAVSLASYLCFRAEEFDVPNTTTIASVQSDIGDVDWNQSFVSDKPNFSEDIEKLYDEKNFILAMNGFAKMFAEIFVHAVEMLTRKVQQVIVDN